MRSVRAFFLAACAVTSSTTLAIGGEAPTFHRDVSRILQAHCQECHRPGQVAPFPLLTWEQARKRAGDLAAVTSERTMPPWHASTTEGGPFRGARILTPAEIATLSAWAEADAPEGNPAEAPAPRTFSSTWALGEPDLILTPSKPFRLSANGRDEFRVFVLPSGLTEGRWISAVDFKAGNPKVVHHILAAFDTTGQARSKDAADDEPGYRSFSGFGVLPSGGLGGWAPGKSPRATPEGIGRYIPAGADVLLQIHYNKSGKEEDDATSIGLYFSKRPVDKLVRGAAVRPNLPLQGFRPKMIIPVGDANYQVQGTWTAPVDIHLNAVVPHMHWLGKDFRLTAISPDGTRKPLIRIDRWDFNWQDTYEFNAPEALPRGTKIELTAHFDNSASNPANPSKPPIEVHWGEQTEDEMCIGFLQYTRDEEHLNNNPPPPRLTAAGRGAGLATKLDALRRFRRNQQQSETPEAPELKPAEEGKD
ncbi:ascorbate-dependent monooxygenase [Isosphaeraceae bacterium EP7]